MTETIAVIDYNMGNLRSVSKALEHVARQGQRVVVTSDARLIANADRIVFPGQGAMRDCMGELDSHGLTATVRDAALGKPFFGICMGLQALMDDSEENPGTRALGIFNGTVRRLPNDAVDPDTGLHLKIPHMGWNRVSIDRPHPMWNGITDGERFYFVHSYFVAPTDPAIVAGSAEYGVKFTCAAARDRLFAVQFHPEKSQHAGLQLMENFLGWNP